jgi:hypothetical protein
MSDALTVQDIADLERIEGEIEADQNSFFRFAKNVCEIRDRRLYRREYKTFEAYCEHRWGWTKRWINQQIQSAEVIRELPKSVGTMVPELTNERQVRELGKVMPEKRAEVLEHAAATGEPLTARSISESAAAVLAPSKPKKDEPKIVVLRDGTGYPIPEERLRLWYRGDSIRKLLSGLSEVRGVMRRVLENSEEGTPDILFAECDTGGIMTELDKAYADLKRAIPYAVCPYCQGGDSDKCRSCKGRGFVSEFFWKSCVPSELRDIRAKSNE